MRGRSNKFAFAAEYIFFIFSNLLAIGVSSVLFSKRLAITPVAIGAGFGQVGRFIVIFLILTGAVFYLLKNKKTAKLIRVLFYLSIFYGIHVCVSALFGFNISIIFSGLLMLAYLMIHSVLIHDVLISIATAGVGAVLGLMLPDYKMLILAIFLAIYDYISVYKTGHMIFMMRRLLDYNSPFGILLPARISNYKESIRLMTHSKEEYVMLGSGDMAIAASMTASTVGYGYLPYFVLTGSVAGLVMLNILFHRGERKPMPGMPFIVGGAILGASIWLMAYSYKI